MKKAAHRAAHQRDRDRQSVVAVFAFDLLPLSEEPLSDDLPLDEPPFDESLELPSLLEPDSEDESPSPPLRLSVL